MNYIKQVLSANAVIFYAYEPNNDDDILHDAICISTGASGYFSISNSPHLIGELDTKITKDEFDEAFQKVFNSYLPFIFPKCEFLEFDCTHQCMSSDNHFCPDCGCFNPSPAHCNCGRPDA